MAKTLLLEKSSVRRTIEIVSEPWTFLIIRECWFGIGRFEHFQTTLGIPRATLAARLKHLVAEGLLERVEYQSRPPRHEYRLTQRGDDLYMPMIVMLAWGDRWLAGSAGPPLHLIHKGCGQRVHADVACSECLDTISARTVKQRPGPGAGHEERPLMPRMRRSTRPENLTRPRADSVARTMQILGDRWSFLLLREAFFGRRRFDEVRKHIGISTNILSSRLELLVENDIFERQPYVDGGMRMEYRLTDKGRDLYPALLALMGWGDKWIAGHDRQPTILHHHGCDSAFRPLVVCSHCRAEISARDMRYEPGPGWDVNFGEELLGVSARPREIA